MLGSREAVDFLRPTITLSAEEAVQESQ